jgi:hypothetical protein
MTGAVFEKIGISLLGPVEIIWLFSWKYCACSFIHGSILHKQLKKKLRGFSPQANYTDRATAAKCNKNR